MDRVGKWIVGIVLVTACTPAETAEQAQARMATESAAAKAYIVAADAKWGVWDAAGHADSIASFFADDARTAYQGAKVATGPAAIRAMLQEGYDKRPPGTRTMAVTTETVAASGPIAIEVGHTVTTYAPAKNAPKGTKATTDTSRYVTYWRKTGDKWLVGSDISSNDRAAPR